MENSVLDKYKIQLIIGLITLVGVLTSYFTLKIKEDEVKNVPIVAEQKIEPKQGINISVNGNGNNISDMNNVKNDNRVHNIINNIENKTFINKNIEKEKEKEKDVVVERPSFAVVSTNNKKIVEDLTLIVSDDYNLNRNKNIILFFNEKSIQPECLKVNGVFKLVIVIDKKKYYSEVGNLLLSNTKINFKYETE